MLQEHLLNPKEFWTNYPLPSIAKSDTSYVKQTYWQGRVWAPMNYLVFEALMASGEKEVAEKLAEKSKELILKECRDRGRFFVPWGEIGTGDGSLSHGEYDYMHPLLNRSFILK